MSHSIHNVKSFFSTPEKIRDFTQNVSSNRLATYLERTNGNEIEAIYLHTLNTAIGSAFHGPLQILELTLRNSLHRELSKSYGEEWYDNPEAMLDYVCRKLIKKSKSDLIKNNNGKKKK